MGYAEADAFLSSTQLLSGTFFTLNSLVLNLQLASYYPDVGIHHLREEKVSKAQANQRAGRAGRTGPGVCYRIYTAVEYAAFSEQPVAEVLRENLANAAFRLSSLGLDLTSFEFIESPKPAAIADAITQLQWLQLVDHENRLTPLGQRVISHIPILIFFLVHAPGSFH